VALLVAAPVAAQSRQRYAVKWSTTEGAEGCSQQNELAAAVAKLVAAELLTSADQADRVIFGVARRDESWHATLSVVDRTGKGLGEREINSDSASCKELSASVALAIALIIDPEHIPEPARVEAAIASGITTPPPAPASIRAAPASAICGPVVPAPASLERPPEFRPRPQPALKAGLVLAGGLLPEVAVGAQLEYWQPIVSANSLRFSLAYFGPQSLEVPDRPGVSAKLYLGTARAGYCPVLAANPRLSVFGCLGLESGLMVAQGQGGGYDNTAVHVLFALDGALTVDRILYGPWAISFTGGAAVTPVRPQFSYETSSGRIAVYRRSALEGRFEAGLAYRF